MSNKANVDKILAKKQSIEIDGYTFDLSLPSADQIKELRALQFKSAAFGEEQLHTQEGLEYLAEYTSKCVQYVLDLDSDDAVTLIFATGGEGGDLFKAVQEFLGLTPAADDGSTDDPS